VPLLPAGTEFEMRMWRYLQTIPFGEPAATPAGPRNGDINAVRAVAGEWAKFPFDSHSCHRVPRQRRSTGYGGGIERKRWLLDHEYTGGCWE